MRILGLDCSTKATAAAIWSENQVLAETFLHIDTPQSQRLTGLLHTMLDKAGMAWQDIDGYSVAIGPGSFTGLRVALATVKGLAQPLGKPVVGVNTLDALARQGWGLQGLIVPVMDARKEEVYTALYKWNQQEGVVQTGNYKAISPGDLALELSQFTGPVHLLGDGAVPYLETFRQVLGVRLSLMPIERRMPRGSLVAMAGWPRLQKGELDDLHCLTPFYLRASEAEVNYIKKHGLPLPEDSP